MNDKKPSRLRRAAKTRVRIRRQEAVRLTVHRTNQHIYAQVVAADGGEGPRLGLDRSRRKCARCIRMAATRKRPP